MGPLGELGLHTVTGVNGISAPKRHERVCFHLSAPHHVKIQQVSSLQPGSRLSPEPGIVISDIQSP